MDTMNLLVFGAGYSATAAIARLKSRGAEIAATTRDADKARALTTQGIDAHVFDGAATTPELAAALMRATHILVSIAPGAEGDPVLEAMGEHLRTASNLTWIGYYSTIGVYGDAGGQWIDETAHTEPLSQRNRYRIDAETAWQALADEKGIPLAVLRLAGIYGPGRSPFDKLRSGKARRINKPGQVFNRIHRDDIAAVTERGAIARLDGIFNVCDDEPAPPQDVIAHAAELAGLPVPPEIGFEEAELSPMARTFYAGNRKVSNARIKKALDYQLAYPTYREGHKAILAEETAGSD